MLHGESLSQTNEQTSKQTTPDSRQDKTTSCVENLFLKFLYLEVRPLESNIIGHYEDRASLVAL